MSTSLLLVDDDRGFASLATAMLAQKGFAVTVAHSLHEARAASERASFEVAVLDRRLPDGDGMTLLAELRAQLAPPVIFMVTALGDVQSAVASIQAGAHDYLVKPVELADLVLKAYRATEGLRLRERLKQAEHTLEAQRPFIRPSSQAMLRTFEMLERVARTPRSPVLFIGETGVGKEVLARHVHSLHGLTDDPFVHVNCAALPEGMAEGELFGHEKGAFTDAKATRRGLVELASGGILFLDEVGELSLSLQAKLLTFLDGGRFRRLGGETELTSTARVLAATHKDLEAEVRKGAFREDLYFRLSVFRIDIPPLRTRPEDILPLATGILERLRQELGRRDDVTLSEEAQQRLLTYTFPGNAREMRNILERALVLESGPALQLLHLAPSLAPPPTPLPGEPAKAEDAFLLGSVLPMDKVERLYARWAMARLGGTRADVARALGLSYPTLLRRLEEPL